jgi:PKD repeat protein
MRFFPIRLFINALRFLPVVLVLIPFISFGQGVPFEQSAIPRASSLKDFDPMRFKHELVARGIPSQTADQLVLQERKLLEEGRTVTNYSYTRQATPNQFNSVCGTCHDMGAEGGWGLWEAELGTTDQLNGILLNPVTLPNQPRFDITAGFGVDRLTPGLRPGDPPITVVAPTGFGNNSIRLGELENDGNGGGCGGGGGGGGGLAAGCVERLTYCFTVGVNDTNFVYAYAFVMENPNGNNSNAPHTLSQMPFVEFLMLDANGDTLSCAYKRYLANDTFAGQYVGNDNRPQRDTAIYKPWTVEGVNLSPYIGQTLTVVITNADCQLGGHFCHSYWDFACGSTAAVVTPNCYQNAPDTLAAPDPPDPSATYSYTWFRNNTPSPIGNTQTIAVFSQPGDTFTVRITTSSGCYWYARYVPVHFTTHTDFNFTTSCGFASFTDSSFSTSSSNPVNFWLWTFGNNVTPPRSTAQDPTPVVFPPGNHTVTLVSGIAYSYGCRDTVSYVVNVPQVPVADWNRSGNCEDAPIQFTSTSSIPAPDSIISYAWTFQGGTPATSTLPNPTVTFSNSGQTQVSLIVVGSNGCSDTTVRNFTVQARPVADFTANSICLGDTLRLVNTSTISVSGANMQYSWTIPGGSPSFSSNRNPSVTFSNPGLVNIQLITVAASGCSDTVVHPVIVSAPPIAAFTAPAVCEGGATAFVNNTSLSPGDSVASVLWYFNGVNPATSTASSPVVTYPAPGVYPVSMVVTNAGGCSDSIQQDVTVLSNPTAGFTTTDVCLGTPSQLTNTSTVNPSGPSMNYVWSTSLGTLSSNSATSPSITFTAPGTATVTLVVNTQGGCSDTVTNTVVVSPVPAAGFASSIECLGQATSFSNSSVATSGDPIVYYDWSFPSATPSTSQSAAPAVTYSTSGTFIATLVVTNSSGCTDTLQQNVTVLPNPVASFTAPPVCLGGSVQVNNSTVVYPSGAAVNYDWNAPGASPSVSTIAQPAFNYNSPGTYPVTLIATANAGCIDTFQLTVDVYPLPVAGFTTADVCFGATSAFTNTTSLSPGDAIGSYQWTFQNGAPPVSGVTDPQVQFGTPGTHAVSLIATTVNGCSDTVMLNATVLPQPVAAFSASPVCLGASVQTVDASTVTPSGTAMNYYWSSTGGVNGSGNPTSPAFQYTAPGNYTITLIVESQVGGCSDTLQQTVTVFPLPSAAFTSSPFCAGVSGALTDLSSVLGTGTIAQYAWNIPGGLPNTSTQQQPTVNFPVDGVYNVSLTVTTADGCVDSVSNPVVVNPIPVMIVPDIQVCPGASGAMVANGAASYLWNTGATTSSILVTPAGTTVYTVTGTSLGCSATATAVAAVSNSMTVYAGSGDTVCLGGSVTLQALPSSGSFQYQWTPSTGLSSTTVSNPVSTPSTDITYSVTVTDINGCSGSSTVSVVIDPFPTASAYSTPVSCFGGSDGTVQVQPAGGFAPYQLSWSNGYTGDSCTGLPVGTYLVTVTDAIGCTTTASTVISEPGPLTVSGTPSAQVPCFGSCTAIGVVVPAGGTAPYQYAWSTTPLQTTATASGLCAGSYSCTVTDANGCTVVHPLSVSQPTPIVPDILSNVPCAGGNTDLTASATGGTGPYSYSWSPSAGLSATNIPNPVAGPPVQTIYVLVVTDANGCVSPPDSVTVDPSIALTVIASVSGPVCPGDTVYLSAVGSFGTGGPYTFSWAPANAMLYANTANPIVTPLENSTYTVTIADGCSTHQDSVTAQVYIPPDPIVSSTPADGCAPLCVTFNSGISPGSASVNWDFGIPGGDTLAEEPTVCYSTPGTYSVNVVVVSPEGCIATPDAPSTVVVHENPSADFTISDDLGSVTAPVFQFTDASSPNVVQWLWSFGDGTPILSGGPVTSHDYSGAIPGNEFYTFVASLYVTTQFGCIDTISRPIKIEPVFDFFIPNAFTPNGDDRNSTFYGKGIGIKEYEMWIFDRWGLQLFNCEYKGSNVPYDHHGEEGMSSLCRWDGKVDGRPVQQDVYVWKVRLTDVFGIRHDYIGRVTVVY